MLKRNMSKAVHLSFITKLYIRQLFMFYAANTAIERLTKLQKTSLVNPNLLSWLKKSVTSTNKKLTNLFLIHPFTGLVKYYFIVAV